PKSYSGLAEGSHTFEVKATDLAGNTGAEASYTWTVDTTAPSASITSSPADPSNDTAPSFGFTASESGSTFECELDGAGFSACSSPKSYSGLAEGSHTFKVKATDAAGNTGAVASYTWSLDTSTPDTSITAGPSDPTSATGATFAFASTESGSAFECRLDGGSWVACSSPKSYTGLADGPHTFS